MACEREEERKIVLVTGGSGLVGTSLRQEVICKRAETDRYDFVFISSRDANLVELNETRLVFEKYKPTYVIHLAAKVGGLYANMRDNSAFYNSNISINENVLRTSLEFGVKKCISCMSTCIFPDHVELPLNESKIHLGPPHESNRGYSLAKREVDMLNRCLNREGQGSSSFVAVIPSNLFGKHDNFDPHVAHVIPGLIHRAYLSIMDAKNNGLDKATLTVLGSGSPLRQFVYAPDLARFLVWCLEYYDDEEPIIVCPDETEEYSIRDVAEMICDICSRKFAIQLQPEFDETHADGQLSKTATNRKMRKLLPDFKFTAIGDGLKVVIDWFCDAYPNVRKASKCCL